jgi:Spx/MgsR family transcriptional regulator
MYQIYGIPNCDTVKKARVFLEKHKINYSFVDFKKTPPTPDLIHLWEKAFGALPVNKQGQTYKKHKEVFETLDPSKKVSFIIENSSMIKRPILTHGSEVMSFGFDSEDYKKKLGV